MDTVSDHSIPTISFNMALQKFLFDADYLEHRKLGAALSVLCLLMGILVMA
ncbi:hypothetical protein WDW89_20490 [Deltaproteobacteria bacterium TL4]